MKVKLFEIKEKLPKKNRKRGGRAVGFKGRAPASLPPGRASAATGVPPRLTEMLRGAPFTPDFAGHALHPHADGVLSHHGRIGHSVLIFISSSLENL